MNTQKIAIHVPVHLLLLLALHRLHLPLPKEIAMSTVVSEAVEAAVLRTWRWWRRRQ